MFKAKLYIVYYIQLIILFVSVIAISSLFSQTKTLEQDNKENYYNALQLIAEKKYENSIYLLKDIIEKDSGFLRAYDKLCQVYKTTDKLQDAEKYFQKLLKKDPENAYSLNSLGLIFLEQKKFGGAREKFKQSIETYSEYAAAYINLIDASFKFENVQYLNEILKINPQSACVYFGFGYIDYKEKNYSNALNYFNKAQNFDAGMLEAYLYKGKVYLSSTRYLNDALRVFLQGLELSNRRVDSDSEWWQAKFLDKAGITCFYLEKSKDALQYYEKSLKIYQKIFDRSGELWKFTAIADVYKQLSDYNMSLNFYNKALEIAKQIEDDYALIRILEAYGWSYNFLYEYPKAIDCFKKALEIARKIGNKQYEKEMHSKIMGAFSSSGKNREVIKWATETLRLAEDTQDLSLKMNAQNNLANAHESFGDYTKALQLYNLNLQEAIASKDSFYIGMMLGNIGGIYTVLNDFSRSMEYFSEALEVAKKRKNVPIQYRMTSNIGKTYYFKDNYDQALEYFEKALEIARNYENKWQMEEEDDLINIGNVYLEMGNHQKARNYFEQAIQICKVKNKKEGEALVRESLGRLFGDMGNHKKALESFQKYLEIAKELENIQMIQVAESNIGITYEKMGLFEVAANHYEETIKKMEAIRSKIRLDEHKISFMKNRVTTYHKLIRVLYKLAEQQKNETFVEKAFNYTEQSKSRSILDLIGQEKVDITKGISPELYSERKKVGEKLEFLQGTIRNIIQEGKRETTLFDSLQLELEKTKNRHEEVREKVLLYHPAYASITGESNPLNLIEVQKNVLKPGQVLLEYFVTTDKCFLFVVQKDTINMIAVPLSQKQLQEMVFGLIEPFRSVKNLMDIEYNSNLANELYKKLISPVESLLEADSDLIIIPDDILFYLPFEALVSELKTSEKNVKYLIEKYPISYNLSASLLDPKLTNKRGQNRKRGNLVAFGNPNYSSLPDSVRHLRSSLGWNFEPLRYSEAEVMGISEIFTESKLYLGNQATEENVKKESGEFSILHFSAHGLLDENQPLYSGVVLTQDDKEKDDGLLQTYEIFNLDLNADLVTLSACETGLGKLQRGEGLIGLTRAFMYAGAKSVMVSLWSVHDQSTTYLMKEFYKNLKEKSLKPKNALRMAKLQLLKETTELQGTEISYSNPFYWAPFVLIGETDFEITEAESRKIPFWMIGFFILFIIGISIVYFYKKRSLTRT